MENPPQVYRQECVSCEVKLSRKGILLGKMPLQFPAVSSPDQVGSLILIPSSGGDLQVIFTAGEQQIL